MTKQDDADFILANREDFGELEIKLAETIQRLRSKTPKFIVTEQTASVIERDYMVEADNKEDAIGLLEEMSGEDKEEALIDKRTVSMNCEITDAEEQS